MTRTERLQAAHAVIVLTAYFDVLEPVLEDLPPGCRVRISSAEQVSLAGGGSVDSGARGIADALVGVDPAHRIHSGRMRRSWKCWKGFTVPCPVTW